MLVGGVRVERSSSFILVEKLKALKLDLKIQNREVFGKVQFKKALALEQLAHWDSKDRSCTLSLEELSARNEAREEFKKWVLLEEISWRQKSREVWLKEGDKNTRFFHNMDNAHWKRNSLARIRINGSWITEYADIKNGVVQAFKLLLSDQGDWRSSLDGMQFERLGEQQAARLEEPFSEEEVFEALMDLSGEKGPGPDGFPMAFWQLSWEFVKVEGQTNSGCFSYC